MEDGKGVDLDGGVEGATMRGFSEAGPGEVARYMRRLASSSPFLPSRAAPAALKPFCRSRADRATPGGGVRGTLGGVERM
jgi:hypothetical protein